MALVCPRCATQNPDGNSFCLACGTPLNAPPQAPAMPVNAAPASPFTEPPAFTTPPPTTYVPAPPPPTTYVPAQPPPPPPGYVSPYYPPATGAIQPPIHRAPWLVIIAAVVVLVVVMAAIGTVLAMGFGRSSNQAASSIQELSSPSPAGLPSPVPTPTITTPTSASNAGVQVPLPDGWTVATQDSESITLLAPSGTGSITIASGASSPPENAQQNKATVDAFFKQQFPDTVSCAGSKTTTGSLNGVAGISWELCFTLTSGAQSVPAAALLFVGANPSGSVYYVMYMLTLAGNMPAFTMECDPILKGIQWKLR